MENIIMLGLLGILFVVTIGATVYKKAYYRNKATSKGNILSRFAQIFADKPIIFSTKKIKIVSFGIYSAISALITSITYYIFINNNNINTTKYTLFFPITAVIIVILSARILNIIEHIKDKHILLKTGFNQQGPVIFSLFLFTYMIITKNYYFILFDALTLGLFLGVTIGRLGCTAYGCCQGIETKGKFFVTYKNPNSKIFHTTKKYQPKKVVPTAIIESIIMIIGFAITCIIPYQEGNITGIFLIFLSFSRIFTNLYRNINKKTLYLSTTVSFLMMIVGILILNINTPQSGIIIYETLKNIKLNTKQIIISTIPATISIIFYGIHSKKTGYFITKKTRHKNKSNIKTA